VKPAAIAATCVMLADQLEAGVPLQRFCDEAASLKSDMVLLPATFSVS